MFKQVLTKFCKKMKKSSFDWILGIGVHLLNVMWSGVTPLTVHTLRYSYGIEFQIEVNMKRAHRIQWRHAMVCLMAAVCRFPPALTPINRRPLNDSHGLKLTEHYCETLHERYEFHGECWTRLTILNAGVPSLQHIESQYCSFQFCL